MIRRQQTRHVAHSSQSDIRSYVACADYTVARQVDRTLILPRALQRFLILRWNGRYCHLHTARTSTLHSFPHGPSTPLVTSVSPRVPTPIPVPLAFVPVDMTRSEAARASKLAARRAGLQPGTSEFAMICRSTGTPISTRCLRRSSSWSSKKLTTNLPLLMEDVPLAGELVG